MSSLHVNHSLKKLWHADFLCHRCIIVHVSFSLPTSFIHYVQVCEYVFCRIISSAPLTVNTILWCLKYFAMVLYVCTHTLTAYMRKTVRAAYHINCKRTKWIFNKAVKYSDYLLTEWQNQMNLTFIHDLHFTCLCRSKRFAFGYIPFT